MSDIHNDPVEIEGELAETRARLGTHLDELSRRLSPGQLLDEGLNYLRAGDGQDFIRNMSAQIRDNPLPVALTGIGIAWLAMAGGGRGSAARSSSRALAQYGETTARPYRTRDDTAERAQRAAAALTRIGGETDDAFRARVSEAQAKVLGVTQQAQETAEAFSDRVRQAMDQARETAESWRDSAADAVHRAGDMAAAGRDQVADLGDRASRAGAYASDAGGRLAHALADNPLLLSAMTMTAGALFGALLPTTEFEERQFGQAGDRAAGAAQGMAQDMLQRGARVVRAAADAGMEAARQEGGGVSGDAIGEPVHKGNGTDSTNAATRRPRVRGG